MAKTYRISLKGVPATAEVAVVVGSRSVASPEDFGEHTIVFRELAVDEWDDVPEPHEIEAKA